MVVNPRWRGWPFFAACQTTGADFADEFFERNGVSAADGHRRCLPVDRKGPIGSSRDAHRIIGETIAHLSKGGELAVDYFSEIQSHRGKMSESRARGLNY